MGRGAPARGSPDLQSHLKSSQPVLTLKCNNTGPRSPTSLTCILTVCKIRELHALPRSTKMEPNRKAWGFACSRSASARHLELHKRDGLVALEELMCNAQANDACITLPVILSVDISNTVLRTCQQAIERAHTPADDCDIHCYVSVTAEDCSAASSPGLPSQLCLSLLWACVSAPYKALLARAFTNQLLGLCDSQWHIPELDRHLCAPHRSC